MPVYNPKRFVQPEALRRIRPASLLELLRPHKSFFEGRGLRLPPARGGADSMDFDKLATVIATPGPDTPADLVDALYYINAMATPEGMHLLLDVVNDHQMTFTDDAAEPGDVAVRAWLKDRRAVELKYAELFAARLRSFKYFQSPANPPAPLPELTAERLRPLEEKLDDVFGAKGRGRGVRVLACPHEHECVFFVRRGDAYRREGALQGREETSVAYRPALYDVVAYEHVTGTLRVHARPDWVVSLYRGQFGLHLFGAIDHFPGEDRYTLEPLRADGSKCLACQDASPIRRVRVTELRLAWGGLHGGVEVHRAADVFAYLAQRKVDMPRGPRIAQATFKVWFYADAHPRSVTIVPPNQAHFARDDDGRAIQRWLALRGIMKGVVPPPTETHDEPNPHPLFAVA